MKRSIAALLLVLALMLSACTVIPEELEEMIGPLKGQEESKPTFREMVYTRPDINELKEAAKTVCEKGKTQTDAKEIMDSLLFYYDQLDHCQTMYKLADIRHSLDLSDPYYKEEYTVCAQAWNQAGESMDTVYRSLAQSPARADLEELYFGEGYFDQYLDEEGQALEPVWSEKFVELLDEEAQLEARYYDVLNGLSQNQADEDYTQKLAQALAPVYLDLIRVRQAMAKEMDYADYESFAWDWSYYRDYTPQEAENYVASIQENLVPLYFQLWNSDFFEEAYSLEVSGQQIQDYVHSAAEHMGGMAEEAWQMLTDQELYDLSRGENKYMGSYEVYLSTYEAPFIFFYPVGSITDYIGFSHEFGHFINDYAAQESYLSVDYAEVQSQTMEYLATSYSLDTDKNTLEALRKMTLANSLSTYIDQAAYHSFESRVYKLTEEELTPENLNKTYAQVLQDFGIEASEGAETAWAEVPHFFIEPFYVLSYVVSNDIAMQIYEKELKEEGTGLELFELLSMQWEDEEFQNILDTAGIVSPFAQERMGSLKTRFQTELIDRLE